MSTIPHARPDPIVRLARAAALAARPDVLLVDPDLRALELSPGEARALLGQLERTGRIRRVRRGAYVFVDRTGNVRADLLDLIAALTPQPYLMTGGRALQFHDLTDQHFRRVHVLVPHQLRPWSWRGDEVRYVPTDASLRRGATRARAASARVATPERAIADSLRHPRWGVTLAQVVEALDTLLGPEPAFADALAHEVARGGGHALARRLGLLVSHLADSDAARGFLPLRGESKAATPLLAGAPAAGPIDPTWRVRVNVDLDRLLQHREVG